MMGILRVKRKVKISKTLPVTRTGSRVLLSCHFSQAEGRIGKINGASCCSSHSLLKSSHTREKIITCFVGEPGGAKIGSRSVMLMRSESLYEAKLSV
jgi:hypothetical protein